MKNNLTLKNKVPCERCRGRNWLIECADNCGGILFLKNKNWKYRKYISGHQFFFRKGSKNPSWKGGIKFDGHGYLEIKLYGHHLSNIHDYAKLHRFVYEYFHKCCLLKWSDVHHINGIKTDNHKGNLMAMTKAKHTIIHNISGEKIDRSNRFCLECNSRTTEINNEGCPNWYRYQNGFSCALCYRRRWRKNKK